MAEVALSFALEKLGQLTIKKLELKIRKLSCTCRVNISDPVKSLSDELTEIRLLLRDVGEKRFIHRLVHELISDIGEVVHDLGDVIETFALEVAARPYLLGLYTRNKLGKQIDDIQFRLRYIEPRMRRFVIHDIHHEELSKRSDWVEQRRHVYPWETDKHVMGLENTVKTLIWELVSGGGEGLEVVGIVGMGGSGKSTLARELYNSLEVWKRFGQRRAWVCVTREFNPKEVMKEVVKQLAGRNEAEKIDKLPESEVRRMVHEQLSGRGYFVVVDDVWRKEDWEYLVSAFPDEQGKTSRLLVTSRFCDIPSRAKYIHKQHGLDSDKAWQLLLKLALIDEETKREIPEECPPELVDVGKRILEKCNGLPLAIRVMGGLLQQEGPSQSGWERVLKGISSNLRTDYDDDDEDPVMSNLELSYHDLPPHLKPCFLSLSFFKKNVVIPARDLTLLWIAEGFIHQEIGAEDKATEDEARSYLDDLINRNMIQVKDFGEDSTEVVNCQVGNHLHELSIRKAREEISLEVLLESNGFRLSRECRHCVMHNVENFMYIEKNPQLRSLFLHRVQTSKVNDIPSNFWKSFKILKVLNLEGFRLETLPKSIRMMVRLRYLGLRSNKLKKLPKALGHLKNLQHLDLAGNYRMEVPNIIWKLESLRHLFMDWDIICKRPLRLDTLKKLQTLSLVLTNNIVVNHLAELASLCKLEMRVGEGLETSELFASMAKLKNPVSIHIILRDGSPFSTDGLGSILSLTRLKMTCSVQKLSDLPQNLSHVSLIKTWLKEDPMPELEKLQKLVYLKLDDALAIKLVAMKVSKGGFPNLEELHLLNLLKLNIQIEKDGVKKLKQLKISNCERLKILPETEEMRLMSNVQEQKMVRVSSEDKISSMEIDTETDRRIRPVEISAIGY